MSHTKGPWRWKNQPYANGNPYISVTAGHGYYSRDEDTGFCFTGLAKEDDGALIAAAPDLLEALRDACHTYAQHGDQPPQKWLDAIEKATVFKRYVHPGPSNYDGWFDEQAFRQAA